MKQSCLCLGALLLVCLRAEFALNAAERAKRARNPVLWADVPDPAIIRVGRTYYMSRTTMHMSPGLPIMKSRDLVNWELVGYAYDTLAEVVQLGNVAVRTAALQNQDGRNVRLLWDGQNMECTNIPEANRFVKHELRKF